MQSGGCSLEVAACVAQEVAVWRLQSGGCSLEVAVLTKPTQPSACASLGCNLQTATSMRFSRLAANTSWLTAASVPEGEVCAASFLFVLDAATPSVLPVSSSRPRRHQLYAAAAITMERRERERQSRRNVRCCVFAQATSCASRAAASSTERMGKRGWSRMEWDEVGRGGWCAVGRGGVSRVERDGVA